MSQKSVKQCSQNVSQKVSQNQGYINRSNLPTGLGARRVSWEHVENMELRCALCLRAPCSVSQSTVLCVSEHRALCHSALCSGSQSTVLWVSEHCALVLRLPIPCSLSQRLFIIHCMFVEGKSRTVFFLQTLLFTAFVATAQKIITYALGSTFDTQILRSHI